MLKQSKSDGARNAFWVTRIPSQQESWVPLFNVLFGLRKSPHLGIMVSPRAAVIDIINEPINSPNELNIQRWNIFPVHELVFFYT